MTSRVALRVSSQQTSRACENLHQIVPTDMRASCPSSGGGKCAVLTAFRFIVEPWGFQGGEDLSFLFLWPEILKHKLNQRFACLAKKFFPILEERCTLRIMLWAEYDAWNKNTFCQRHKINLFQGNYRVIKTGKVFYSQAGALVHNFHAWVLPTACKFFIRH